MQFEGVRRSGQVPNLTPLIDIVFLLLVFFMLTAYFVRDEGLPIELPEASSAAAIEEQQPLKIEIGKGGMVLLNGAPVTIDGLADHLKTLLAARENKRVVLHGDRAVPLGDTVRVMDAARLAGATGLDIVTEQPAP